MIALSKTPKKLSWIFSASIIMFVSANFVNAGNMVFNLLFSRWMGPALFSDLAFLLTLKLSILGVFNAIQFLVTEIIAKSKDSERPAMIQSYRLLSAYSSLIIILCLPFLIYGSLYLSWAEKLGLSSEWSLVLFFLGFPVYLPLALARGVAQGEVNLKRIVLSANAEMLVRLLGGAAFWWAGFGLSSVIFAFVLSLIAAWYFARPAPESKMTKPEKIRISLPIVQALPWAAIQLTVVLALDGDVFVAKQALSSEAAGLIAAISLVQRIIFFASFSLAAILLPQVISDVKSGGNGLRKTIPIIGLIAFGTTPILIALHVFPERIVSLLFGSEFLDIAPVLFMAGVSATIVTINYFLVIFYMAHQRRSFALLFLILATLQLTYLFTSTKLFGGSIENFVQQKLYFQILSIVILASLTILGTFKKPN